ncbi:MAG: T9SS type A sorting domain-containing protein, partial [Calditrichaeota bacterium]|nr:T9SS type A sorting domain-containing protein [Calditrichota bacterium]
VLTTDRRIVRVALSGRGVPLSAENDVRIPLVFALYPVHPNPFNQLVQICYTLPAESDIRLTIYDLNGRLVEQLASERKDAGRYTLSWTAKGIASGLYILRLESGKEVRNQKLMLIR